MKKDLLLILKGFIIGSSMSVPGVSGGTMAILLGIYDQMIQSVSHFFQDIKKNMLYLGKICIGGVLGLFSLAFLIKTLLETFPIPTSFFFLGAVIGGIPALYKKTKNQKLHLTSGFFFFLGLALVLAIGFIPTGNFSIQLNGGLTELPMIFITGIVIAIALVLPGISTSHMLLVLGMYDAMLFAITSFDVAFLAVLGISVLVGVFLITKPIEWTMNKFPHQTYYMIIGFVLGSTSEIFRDKILPSIPTTTDTFWWISTLLLSTLTFALGLYAISSVSKYSND